MPAAKALKPCAHHRLGLLDANAGKQPAHHFDPVEMVIEEARALFFDGLCRQSRDGVNRQEEGGIGLRIDPEEAGSADTDHRKREIVEQDRLPDHGRGAVEAPLPIRVSQHHHRRSAGAVVGITEQTSRGGWNTQPAEVVAGNESTGDGFGLAAGDDVEVLRIGVGKQRGEDILFRTQNLIGGEREVGAGGAALAIAVVASVNAFDYRRAARHVPFRDRQFLRMGHRQSAQQDCVHEAVDGSVGANAER